MTGENSYTTCQLESLLGRLRAGDEAARGELIDRVAGRVVTLTRRMFRDYRRLGRWEQTEDIGQNATLRLWHALKAAPPETPAQFHRLAALQIRRELVDQVRRYFGPEGMAARHESNVENDTTGSTPQPAYDEAESTTDPGRLARWAEFHERASALAEEERAVFDLVWYQGLSRDEAAELLGISKSTLKRRWLAARLALCRIFGGSSPV